MHVKCLIRLWETEQYSEIYMLGWILSCMFHVTGMAGEMKIKNFGYSILVYSVDILMASYTKFTNSIFHAT